MKENSTVAGVSERCFVVTGGSMGLGRACAEAVLRAGGSVMLAARGSDALARTQRELADAYGAGRVRSAVTDVTDVVAVERLFDEAAALGPLAGVVHAAAVLGPIGSVLEVDAAEWLEALRIDLFGSYVVAQQAARRLQASGGSIVLFSGGGGTAAFPRYSAYACSKAGVVRLAETLARELEPYGIRVNAVAPGFVVTRMHDATLAAGERAGEKYVEYTRRELERGGVPAELGARATLFLLSDASAGITGRLLAAPWDDWEHWSAHSEEIAQSDLFMLRRIVPKDRGLSW